MVGGYMLISHKMKNNYMGPVQVHQHF